MNMKIGLNYGTRLIKAVPKIKFNPDTIGYMHSNGQISFVSQDATINYAKNRVIKALNCDKPFERGIVIEGNTICLEVDGYTSAVLIQFNNAKGNNIITVHGHPDAVRVKEGEHPCFLRNILSASNNKIKNNGITYPISLSDYRSLMLSSREKKAIVYNSRGEYSILTKNKTGMSMNNQDFNEISNEYYMTVPTINSYYAIIKHLLKSLKYLIQSPTKAEHSMLDEANKLSNKIHEFLSLNTNQYGVTYETNYSNLIKK